MIRSLYSGISGMKNHQTRMDVVGNNIANVNTYGYKGGRVNFQDALSQTIRSGGAGTNPAQVGSGMTVGSISNNFTQGPMQSTGRTLDLGIQGNGFFVVKDGSGNEYYTREGVFFLDDKGYLVNGDGLRVQSSQGDIRVYNGPISTINIEPNGAITGTNTEGKPLQFSSNPVTIPAPTQIVEARLVGGSITEPTPSLGGNGSFAGDAISAVTKTHVEANLRGDSSNPAVAPLGLGPVNMSGYDFEITYENGLAADKVGPVKLNADPTVDFTNVSSWQDLASKLQKAINNNPNLNGKVKVSYDSNPHGGLVFETITNPDDRASDGTTLIAPKITLGGAGVTKYMGDAATLSNSGSAVVPTDWTGKTFYVDTGNGWEEVKTVADYGDIGGVRGEKTGLDQVTSGEDLAKKLQNLLNVRFGGKVGTAITNPTPLKNHGNVGTGSVTLSGGPFTGPADETLIVQKTATGYSVDGGTTDILTDAQVTAGTTTYVYNGVTLDVSGITGVASGDKWSYDLAADRDTATTLPVPTLIIPDATNTGTGRVTLEGRFSGGADETLTVTKTTTGYSINGVAGPDILSDADVAAGTTYDHTGILLGAVPGAITGDSWTWILKADTNTATNFPTTSNMLEPGNTGTGNVTLQGTFTGTANETLTVVKTNTGYSVDGGKTDILTDAQVASGTNTFTYKGMSVNVGSVSGSAVGDRWKYDLRATVTTPATTVSNTNMTSPARNTAAGNIKLTGKFTGAADEVLTVQKTKTGYSIDGGTTDIITDAAIVAGSSGFTYKGLTVDISSITGAVEDDKWTRPLTADVGGSTSLGAATPIPESSVTNAGLVDQPTIVGTFAGTADEVLEVRYNGVDWDYRIDGGAWTNAGPGPISYASMTIDLTAPTADGDLLANDTWQYTLLANTASNFSATDMVAQGNTAAGEAKITGTFNGTVDETLRVQKTANGYSIDGGTSEIITDASGTKTYIHNGITIDISGISGAAAGDYWEYNLVAAVTTPATSFTSASKMPIPTGNTGTGDIKISGQFNGTSNEILTVEKTATGWSVDGGTSDVLSDIAIASGTTSFTYNGLTINLSTVSGATSGDRWSYSLTAPSQADNLNISWDADHLVFTPKGGTSTINIGGQDATDFVGSGVSATQSNVDWSNKDISINYNGTTYTFTQPEKAAAGLNNISSGDSLAAALNTLIDTKIGADKVDVRWSGGRLEFITKGTTGLGIKPTITLSGTDAEDFIGTNPTEKEGTASTQPPAVSQVPYNTIRMVSFQNAEGLVKNGKNLYVWSQSAGDPVNADGVIQSGYLEMSNVDLTEEFTNMITTQRGYQANARVITVSDSLLEELIQLKR